MHWDFGQKPLLVFWETTKACKLACKHCRADAIDKPLPGELDTREAEKLIDEISSFGMPYPIIIFTGGDALMRKDLNDVLHYAAQKGITCAVSPSATPLLTESALAGIKESGAFGISISLDGMAVTHEKIRGVEGTWKRSIDAIKAAVSLGMKVQVNTCVMKSNVNELPELFGTIKKLG
ncbi:MAG: radical SAM protein, partial [Candidatus Aenigmarchaeota archaeon]|nr:radical SAM protein [Candidatus Aenigmarchaeota archaeon]